MKKETLTQGQLEEIKKNFHLLAKEFTITSKYPIKKDILLKGTDKHYIGWTVWAEKETTKEVYLLVIRDCDKKLKKFPQRFITEKIITKNV